MSNSKRSENPLNAWHSSQSEIAPHKRLFADFRNEMNYQSSRYTHIRRYYSMYEYGQSTQVTDGPMRSLYGAPDDFVINVCKRVIDSIVSETTLQDITPMALAKNGSYSDLQKARMYTDGMEAEFDAIGINRVKREICRDFHISGLGMSRTYTRAGKLYAERMHPQDVVFPAADAFYGHPTSMVYRLWIDRYRLLALYKQSGEHFFGSAEARKRAILSCSSTHDETDAQIVNSGDVIEVLIGWRLASLIPDDDDKESDGKYAVCINNCTLEYREFRSTEFQAQMYCPVKQTRGVWGIPTMRQLYASQVLHNELMRCAERAFQNQGMSIIYLPDESGISQEMVTNGFGYIMQGKGGAPPQFFSPTPINPEFFQFDDRIIQNMVRDSLSDEMAVNGQMPAGMDDPSGRAMLVSDSIKNRKQAPLIVDLERWILDTTKALESEIRENLLPEYPDAEVVNTRDRRGFRNLKWKDILMDPEDCAWRVFPISGLSQNPELRFRQLERLLNLGSITMNEFKKYHGIPVFERELDLSTSAETIIDYVVDQIVLKGKTTPPDPNDNMQYALKRGLEQYHLFRQSGVPEERLGLLRDYLDAVKEEIRKTEEGMGGQAPPPPEPGPPGPAGPPPPEQPPMM